MKLIKLLILSLVLVSCSDEANAATQDPSAAAIPSGTLPVLNIETENRTPITSKETYLSAKYWLDTKDIEGYEALGSESAPLDMQIRGRGHSSWKGIKKPYKIKFAKKTAVLGLPKNKHFALLKPTEDLVAGFYLSELTGMAWTPSIRPVEVVLNGEYIGLYYLTETIRIDENRVNIFEQQDQETDPETIKGGWLVEVDNYYEDTQIVIPETSSLNIKITYHSPEDLSSQQKKWLTDEFNAFNQAVYSNDKTSREWEEYVDVESMARFFIVQELVDNPDGFHGSFYLHKDLGEGAKWTAGPVWDLFSQAREKTDYTFRMKASYGFTPHWIGQLIQYESFCKAVDKAWHELYPEKLSRLYTYVDEIVLPLSAAWEKDHLRWGGAFYSAQSRADRIKNAIRDNAAWLDRNLPVSPYASLSEISVSAGAPVTVYNLQGMYIGDFDSRDAAISALSPGIYIIGGEKVMIGR